MREELLISLFLVFIVLFISAFIFYEFFPREEKLFVGVEENNTGIIGENVTEDFPDGALFYPNLRFPQRIISFHIEENCNENRANLIRKAFEILDNETILNFIEMEKGNIEVTCGEKETPQEEYFIAGEGGPISIINASNYYVITNGTVLLYRDNKCPIPIVGIHEILHVLGFKHSLNKKSIMYEISDCNQKITKEIVDIINNNYKTETLPDLIIKKASAVKYGNRLYFEVEVFNAGLSSAINSTVGIFADGKELAKYDVESLDIGSGRVIIVSNLRSSGEIKEILFFADILNQVYEIDEGNNGKKLIVV
ncbi:MAG: CARDB domain-containing protein [Candidatus Pacearchaeota archaeon]